MAEEKRVAIVTGSSNAPLKSVCRPEDIAETIVWLVEGAHQVTGETIFVDGGMHIVTAR